MFNKLIETIENISPKKNDGKYAGGYTDACDFAVKKIKKTRDSFTEYLETHYLIVEFIEETLNLYFDCNNAFYEVESYITKDYTQRGTGSKFEMARQWTDEFQEKYKDEDWLENDWYDTLEVFLNEKNKL